jgi:hypothetical protein
MSSIVNDISKSLSAGEEVIGVGSSVISNFKKGSSGGSSSGRGNGQDIKGQIPQTERLFTTRSRSVNHQGGGGNRGQRAFIKLLTTDKAGSLTKHLDGSGSKPTSLGKGILKDAINSEKGYDSFLLTDIQCSLEEKLQVVEVFGDAEVSYYFGRQPVMFTLSGILIDSPDNNWFIEFLEMYSHVMRGSQLARNYELIQIVLPSLTLIGTISGMNFSQNANRDVDVPFSIRFLAKKIIPTPVELPNSPLTNLPAIDFSQVNGFLSQSGINDIKVKSLAQLSKGLKDVISNPLSTVKDFSGAFLNGAPNIADDGGGFGTAQYSAPASIVNDDSAGIDAAITKYGPGEGGAPPSFENRVKDALNSVSDTFAGVTANLNGVRASLFNPIYGVLTSLTKLIKNVGGDIASLINSFTAPIRDILRDVRNIANQAIGVVNLINNSIRGFSTQVQAFDRDIKETLATLKKTAGVITSAPKTIGESIRNLFNAGKLPITTRFLQTGGAFGRLPSGTQSTSKGALLNSGPKHTPERGARI